MALNMQQPCDLPSRYTVRQAVETDLLSIINLSIVNIIKFFLIAFAILLIISLIMADELAKIILFCIWAVFFVIIIITFYLVEWQPISSSDILIVEFNGKIVACSIVKHYSQYSELYRLFVQYGHRNQGLGSCLVKKILQTITQPIYVISVTKALNFYIRQGFLPIPRYRLPQRYRQLSRQGALILGCLPEWINSVD